MSFFITLVVGALLTILLWKVFRSISAIWRKKQIACKIPGHDGIPIFGAALSMGSKSNAENTFWMLDQVKLARERGDSLFRVEVFHETFVIPATAEGIKPLLDSRTEINKGMGYEVLAQWLGSGLLISTGEKWRSRRKMITPTFHFQQLEDYTHIFNSESKILLEVLENDAKSGEIDLLPYIKRAALDIICGAAMGRTIGAQSTPDHAYLTAVRDLLRLGSEYSMKLYNWIPIVWWMSGRAKLWNDSLYTLLSFTRKIVKERREMRETGTREEGRASFLDMLLDLNDNGQLSDEDIREEVDTFMFGGHDTTSAGVAWTLWCIANHPNVQEQLYQEIMSVVGDDDITTTHLSKMEYLHRVIKEVFRLYSPVPMANRRLQEDLQCAPYQFDRFFMQAYVVPKGVIFSIPPIILHRNEKVWGDNVDEFDPDRFLDDNVKDRHPYDYIPFSAGLRNCIGQKFALFEAKVITSYIVRHFVMTTKIPFKENTFSAEVILIPDKGVPLMLTPRAQMDSL